jgi:hypothetical protein
MERLRSHMDPRGEILLEETIHSRLPCTFCADTVGGRYVVYIGTGEEAPNNEGTFC